MIFAEADRDGGSGGVLCPPLLLPLAHHSRRGDQGKVVIASAVPVVVLFVLLKKLYNCKVVALGVVVWLRLQYRVRIPV